MAISAVYPAPGYAAVSIGNPAGDRYAEQEGPWEPVSVAAAPVIELRYQRVGSTPTMMTWLHYETESGQVRTISTYHSQTDADLASVVLICDDFAGKQGPIFSPAFLRKELFPRVRRLTSAWQSHGVKVIYHSDGNYKTVIPDLVDCGVDGFYCLEPALGMGIVELKQTWPEHVWAGGVDGVDLMQRGRPEQVTQQVRRHIQETNALQSGGMFVGTTSEINPPVSPENFRAMVEAVGEVLNPDFVL